ncbi:MAG: hypothetical protein IT378_10855 [Sandaracinaceae bacterium]|nr:hypothetical protein [Sandaracinaceae bacterium]
MLLVEARGAVLLRRCAELRFAHGDGYFTTPLDAIDVAALGLYALATESSSTLLSHSEALE